MEWKRVCRLDEVPTGGTRAVAFGDGTALICRVGEGDVCAIEDLCTHDEGPLGQGRLYGAVIECPRHGAEFDVRSGAVRRLPAVVPLRTYPTRLRDGWVEIAEEAEPC